MWLANEPFAESGRFIVIEIIERRITFRLFYCHVKIFLKSPFFDNIYRRGMNSSTWSDLRDELTDEKNNPIALREN